jgi:hypothetical protein
MKLPHRSSRALTAFLFAGIFLCAVHSPAQELQLGFFPKVYTQGEEVWASIAVTGVTSMPGAFTASIVFDSALLAFRNVMAANNGPFAITPAISISGNTLTLAGFQGVDDGAPSSYTVLTLISFVARKANVTVDSSLFGWKETSVFSTDGQKLALVQTIRNGTALRSERKSPGAAIVPPRFERGYLVFSLPHDGMTRLSLFTLKGSRIDISMKDLVLRAGTHAIPLGRKLPAGIYVLSIASTNYSATYRMGVAR